MKRIGHQNHFVARLEAVRTERAALKAERVRLDLRDEELLREEERLLFSSTAPSSPRYLVRTEHLLDELNLSIQSFLRLRNNPARGFPKPVTALDSDPRWKWSDVETWLDGGA